MRAVDRPLAIAAFLAAAGCEPWSSARDSGDDGGGAEQEALVVSPARLDFGTLSVLDDVYATDTFTVTNAGTETVAVHGHDEPVLLEGPEGEAADDAVFLVAGDPVFELRPGESRSLLVTFRPTTEASWTAELRVNYGIEVLTLAGSGTAPVAALDGPDGAWSVPFACEDSRAFTLSNAGSEPLHVEDAWIVGDEGFSVADGLVGAEVAPGGTVTGGVRFAPAWSVLDAGLAEADLYVQTDDPRWPVASAPLSALAYAGSTVEDDFTYAPGLDADVVFAVDTAGVMDAYLDRARGALDDFVDALDAGNVDLHAAVLTGAGPCPPAGWTGSDAARDARIEALEAGLDGDPGAWDDALLGLAAAGLAEDRPGGCMEGFLREGAQLHVVVIAGGPDGSGEDPEAALAALRAAAPDASGVVVSAIIATDDGACGGVSYGEGYADAAVLSGGVVGDLCASDWEASFADLAAVSVLAARGGLAHPLDFEPLVDSITVRVDGATWTDWTWDAEANAVVFDDAAPPAAGSTVEIRYVQAVECP